MDSRGYSLIEVLIIVGIVAVSLLALAGISVELEKSSAYSESKISLTALSGVIRETLRYQKSCNTALVGQNPSLTSTAILAGTQEISLLVPGILGDGTPNDDLLQAGAQVQKLNITSVKLVNSFAIGAGIYFSEIQLEGRVAATGMALAPIISGGFFYSLSAPIAGALNSCDTKTDDPVSLCEEMGCTWNTVATPPCNCSPIDLTCPPQQFLTGVQASGLPICTPLGAGPCPAGQYLRGVAIGTNDCVNLPTVTVPSSTAANGACGSSNGGTFGATPNSNLCNAGNPSTVTLVATLYSWTCTGTSTTATCTANYSSGAPSGSTCLAGSYQYFGSPPTGSYHYCCDCDCTDHVPTGPAACP